MSIADIKHIEEILQSEYSVNNYIQFIQEIFDNVKLIAPYSLNKEYTNFSSHIEASSHVGYYTTPDNKKLIIYSVKLKKESYVENSRSTHRSYAKQLIENSNSEAALVAFYTENDPKWRLSFVRLDYEMTMDKGKMKLTANMTPAKRYSFLVGKDEPCHTAIDRFRTFIQDKNYNPTLDELEEAFSVEAVTKEFFNQYCEKFKQILAHLEDNHDFVEEAAQHNFTAAQFAKKLMGQIVFLYFLQKKGWLGVNAWPKVLDEKAYKKAFYARGSKSKQLIPVIYRQAEDGNFYLTRSGLESLNVADEEILANCVIGSPWGTGPRNFMRKLFNEAVKKKANFFDDYLEPLFYNALNVNRGEQGYDPDLHCRIPFLSGGLFEPIDGYDWEHNDFAIPNEIFSNRQSDNPRTGDGILDVFDRYNFTMSEDEPLEREVAIDPEMLGKVFENLLEVKDRKAKGAFYTPREIVHYMCQESLINYLKNAVQVDENSIRDFILYGDFMKDEDTLKKNRQGNGELMISPELFKVDTEGNIVVNRLNDIDNALQEIRVADPAVGSGAFPLGMLNEIVRARQNISAYMAIGMKASQIKMMYSLERSPYVLKRETIRNCIFAADIEPSAVDIARLRLWLALVIDDEVNGDVFGHANPLPLPNLECNIVCGNSLIDEFEGVPLINQSKLISTEKNGQLNLGMAEFEPIVKKLIEVQDELFKCEDTNKKHELLESINTLKNTICISQIEDNGKAEKEVIEKYKESTRMASKPYVLWQIDFARVFREKGGFDVVIGNPPYVDSEEMTRSMPKLREYYTSKYETAKGNWDLFVLFIERAYTLADRNGYFSYIVPNKLIAAPYTKKIREKLLSFNIISLRDYSNVEVFKEAAVYPVVFRISKNNDRNSVNIVVMDSLTTIKTDKEINCDTFYSDIDWDKYFNTDAVTLELMAKISNNKSLKEYATVKGAATVNEAYLVKEILKENSTNEIDKDDFKFINTGTIDKYVSLWGIKDTRYIKGKYMNPYLKKDDLKSLSDTRLYETKNNKVIIGGMNKTLEAFYDEGEYLAGKSTTIILDSKIDLKYILAVLNSTLMSFYYSNQYNSMSLAGGFFRIGPPQIKDLPIAIPEDNNLLSDIVSIVDKIIDVLDNKGINEEFKELYKTCDSLVNKCYGLSDEENNILSKLNYLMND